MVIITSYEKDYRVVLLCVLYGSYCCSLLNLVLRAFNSVVIATKCMVTLRARENHYGCS